MRQKWGCAALAAVLLLGGCWAAKRGLVYLAGDYDRLGIVSVAWLPMRNQTESDLRVTNISTMVGTVVGRDRHYRIVAEPAVAAAIARREFGTEDPFVLLRDKMSVGEEPPPESLGRLATLAAADAVGMITVLECHEVREDHTVAGPDGRAVYAPIPVGYVGLRAWIWGKTKREVVWSDEAHVKVDLRPNLANRGFPWATEACVRRLFARLPENRWKPAPPPAPQAVFVPGDTP